MQLKASERMCRFLHGQEVDRLPMIEWAPWWHLTVEKWKSEIPSEHVSYLGLQEYFGLDKCRQTFFSAFTVDAPQPKHHGAGILSNKADYDKIKKTLYPDPSMIISKDYVAEINKSKKNGDIINWFTVEGMFWFPRTLFGIEPHLYSFYDEADLLHEICRDYVEWLYKVTEFIGNNLSYDYMSFAEDMSYNNGPMLSKDTFDEFLLPYYKQIIPVVKKLDTSVFIDSDGNITKAVDWYAEAGADGMFPLERQAGVDVSLYLTKQPKMFFLGHFDKMCLKFGEKAIRAEFERLLPSMKSKKFIPSIDHQTPPDCSVENYKIYINLFKEYLAK